MSLSKKEARPGEQKTESGYERRET